MGEPQEPSRPYRRFGKGQYLRPRPVKRTPEEEEDAAFARLLTHDWSILSPSQRREALKCALIQGRAWVEEFGRSPEKDGLSSHTAYFRSAVRFAYYEAKVLNEVEYELWRRHGADDERVASFASGVRRELLRSHLDRVTRDLDGNVEALMERARTYAKHGGDVELWFATLRSFHVIGATTLARLKRRLQADGLLD